MINNNLNIAVVSLPIKWADRHANLQAVKQQMAGLKSDTDLVVLPELFTTGFIPDPDVLVREAEPSDGLTMTTVRELASQYRMAIAGSFLARLDGSDIANRAFLVEPSGETTFYDKRHLFSLSPEASLLKGGRHRMPVVRFRGWNIALAVCYDLRFPVWCRNAGMAYDIALFPSNWPQSRGYAYHQLLVARAIENLAWTVGADCSGTDDFGCYDGMSVIVDHEGKIVAQSSTENPEKPIYAVTDRIALEKWRKRMPAWKAADDFTIVL